MAELYQGPISHTWCSFRMNIVIYITDIEKQAWLTQKREIEITTQVFDWRHILREVQCHLSKITFVIL